MYKNLIDFMKQISFLLIVAIMLILPSCAQASKNNNDATQTQNQETMKKNLVAYFSASGTTARVATNLAKAADADLFEIRPAQPYTNADLNWNDKQSRSTLEMNDKNSRPAIADKVENMEQYDTIYVGYPIWWYTAPRIMNTFLEQYDLSGKTIIPFATSGGSGLGKSGDELKEASAPNAKWLPGRLLNGNPSVDSLVTWVQSIR